MMSGLATRGISARLLYAVTRCKFNHGKHSSSRRKDMFDCQHQVCKRQIHSSQTQAVSLGTFAAESVVQDDVETNTLTYATPREIKDFLDKHVIGQEQAKQRLAVTAYYHKKIVEHNVAKLKPPKWKGADLHDEGMRSINTAAEHQESMNAFAVGDDESDDIEIEKGNIVLLGPSGSGKTLLARTLAKVLKVPFAEWDCTTLTSPGYVGDDAADVITRLLQNANYDVTKCEQGIVFLDEVDKISKKTDQNTKDINGEGVQQTLLKMLEGTQVKAKTKEGGNVFVNTTNILFIVAGAFNGIDEIVKKRMNAKAFGLGAPVSSHVNKEDRVDILSLYGGPSGQEKNAESDKFTAMAEAEDLRKYGLMPEFVGRIPNIVTLHSIDEDALVRILTEPESSYVKQYKLSFELDDCQLEITDEALRAIAKRAIENRTGARSLGSILESILLMPAYEVPQSNIKKVIITEDVVNKKTLPEYVYEETAEEKNQNKQVIVTESQ